MLNANRRLIQCVGIDLDQVLVDLHAAWLRWGNKEFGTNLSTFSYWDQPTETWGSAALDFFKTRPYANSAVDVIRGAADVVKRLRALGYTVEIVTTCLDNEDEKQVFCLENELITAPYQFQACTDKGDFFGDLLVDDAAHNLRNFRNGAEARDDEQWEHGLPGVILVNTDHNAHDRQSFGVTIDSIHQLPNLLLEYPFADYFEPVED